MIFHHSGIMIVWKAASITVLPVVALVEITINLLNCEHHSLAFTSLDKGIGGGICHTIHVHTLDCLLTCSHHHVALLLVVHVAGGRRPRPPAYSLVILVRTVVL